ncbi:PID-CTERM protein-sorting domain-containing protein [Gracilimonas halophila]|uniref:PID-CTERM protein-sorting domain-containing protein n=1 Tax=Gracilimonas halophila TaxID=1834464 RepID=A0ABW5JM66_9BACT
MKTLIYLLLACTLVFILTSVLVAQPFFPGPPSQAPIDGGLSLLAAAGGGYAIKKLRDRKKAEEQEMQDLDI